MIKLYGQVPQRWLGEPFVARVTTNPQRPRPLREVEVLLGPAQSTPLPEGFRAHLRVGGGGATESVSTPVVDLPESLQYLTDGDVVRINPHVGQVSMLYRKASHFNALFLTERCNSNCVMCSQPPKDVQDGYLVQDWLTAMPLMGPDTPELGITGGEPTLLGDDLLRVVQACRNYLPRTALHMLSNGRLFNYLSLAKAVAEIGHPDLVIGVPLYADTAERHDHVVQAKGAFDQTIRGLMNLARCGVRIEIRVVLHRLTVDRPPELARFIARNLPFVEQVALMGLEMMGYVRMNLDALWVDPADYQRQLAMAVGHLAERRMNVVIYNHQLCVLDQELWPYATRSISDWKNEYLPLCEACAVRGQCGGFFASSLKVWHSNRVRPIVVAGAGENAVLA